MPIPADIPADTGGLVLNPHTATTIIERMMLGIS